MLIAKDGQNKVIDLTSTTWTKEELNELKKTKKFFCPACKHSVQLKVGKVRIPHFAHIHHKSCQFDSEHESIYHMKGKFQLFHWLKHQRLTSELEKYFPTIKQRSDVFVQYKNQSVPIEYQCSKIPIEHINQRTDGYLKEKMMPLWVLGGTLLQRKQAFAYRFTSFHWSFIRLNNNEQPFLLSYCSNLQSFILLEMIIPFSKQIVFAQTSLFPIKKMSFVELLNPMFQNLSTHFYEEWFRKVYCFRQNRKVKLSKAERMLQTMLYEQAGLPLICLPSEAFFPLSSGWMIDESVYIWQSIVLIALQKIPERSVFHLEKVVWFIRPFVRFFPIRENRCSHGMKLQSVILQYFNSLTEIGILTKVGPYSFRKNKDILLQKNLETIIRRDQQLLQNICQKYEV
ncbi:competence protein CoiA [Bacillus alveayuensis]|jgi:competence protein CoiA|uniref:competence protein CoiA n=1 Tax=Aeribacillus alveayuensis TaxID=279215 RepID=UPI0005D1115A|nr:competence protein CoiA family protein [Bacillus alveayuensis]